MGQADEVEAQGFDLGKVVSVVFVAQRIAFLWQVLMTVGANELERLLI